MKNLEFFRKQRGKKLTGIRKLQTDKYSDQNADGIILKFGTTEEVCIYADGNKLIVEKL